MRSICELIDEYFLLSLDLGDRDVKGSGKIPKGDNAPDARQPFSMRH